MTLLVPIWLKYPPSFIEIMAPYRFPMGSWLGIDFEGCLLAIEKLEENVREETIGGGLLLVQQLQGVMKKILTNVKRIWG